MSLNPQEEINRRRTFAIISHPDAGKTTITEKLLLFGGAIQMAGAVRGRTKDRSTTSDFLKVEQERGISVSSAVMSFDYKERAVNLLDTPGHADFSEDTYRVLTAVDSALMVPPSISMSSLQIARPSPVPPNFLVVEASSCWKGVKSFSERAGSKPMPESLTLISIKFELAFLAEMTTDPSWVNLMALPIKLMRICWRRPLSPWISKGTSLSI